MDIENFFGGAPISSLQISCDSLPQEKGVYVVVRRGNQPTRFLRMNTGCHLRGRNPTVRIPELRRNWIEEARVLYIGKAGGTGIRTTLRKRVRCFIRFGLGYSCAHWGGRYIWQIAGAQDLVIYWKSTPNQEPREVERALIDDFKQTYGRLPFANLRS